MKFRISCFVGVMIAPSCQAFFNRVVGCEVGGVCLCVCVFLSMFCKYVLGQFSPTTKSSHLRLPLRVQCFADSLGVKTWQWHLRIPEMQACAKWKFAIIYELTVDICWYNYIWFTGSMNFKTLQWDLLLSELAVQRTRDNLPGSGYAKAYWWFWSRGLSEMYVNF